MEKDLKILAKQREARPVYARVISWEFSNTDQWDQPVTGRRRHRSNRKEKQKEGEDEENVEETLSGSGSFSDSGSTGSETDEEYVSAAEILDNTDEDEGEVNDDGHPGTECVFGKGEQPEESKTLEEPVRRRRHSSRKKRKWQRKLKSFEYMAPYAHTDNLDLDSLWDAKESMLTGCENLHVDKPVPTLVELCLRANTAVCSSQVAPPLLKQLVQHHRGNQSLGSIQLNWLHHMLAYYESFLTGSQKHNNLYHWVMSALDEATNTQVHEYHPVGRSVWTQDETTSFEHVFNAILPFTHCIFSVHQPSQLPALSVIAATINLMLPASISHNYGAQSATTVSDSETVNKACKDSITRVKYVLSSRYPRCMAVFFENAVPYVWWAKGNAQLAEEAFMNLVETHDCQHADGLCKSVYLSEMARLFIQFGKPERAARCFSWALELADKPAYKCTGRQAYRYEAPLQVKILTAAALDSGVLSSNKCASAARLWQDAIDHTTDEDGVFKASVVYAASASMMCVYAGWHSDFHSSWQEEVQIRLQLLSATHPQFHLYLSFLYALQDEADKSLQSFQSYTHRFSQNYIAHSHDLKPTGTRGRTFNVWQPLLDVHSRQKDVRVLSVVWRTHLCHPVFQPEGNPHVADYNAKKMSLWMTADGYLTGDMSMCLPPVEQVTLNPFTGQLVVSQQGQGMTLRNIVDSVTDEFGPPRVVQVFHNPDNQVTVSLVQSVTRQEVHYKTCNPLHSKRVYTDCVRSTPCQCCVLHYGGPDGQAARLDLKKLLKAHKRKAVEEEIRSAYKPQQPSEEYLHSVTWVQDMMDCLQQYFSQGWDFSYKTLAAVVKNKHEVNKQRANEKQEPNKSTSKKAMYVRMAKRRPNVASHAKTEDKKGVRKVPPPSLVSLKLERYWVIGQSLLLHVIFGDGDTDATVVVNCSSVESFQKPRIHFHGLVNNLELMAPACPQEGDTSAAAFMLAELAHARRGNHYIYKLLFFNVEGDLLHEQEVEMSTRDDRPSILTHVIGGFMFGASKTLHRMTCDGLSDLITEEKLPSDLKQIEVFHNMLLLNTEHGIGFCDSDMKLIMWKHSDNLSLKLSEDRHWLSWPLKPQMALLAKRCQSSSRAGIQGPVMRALVAISNHVLVLEVPESADKVEEVSIVLDVELPGWPTEACFISEQDGFAVTANIFSSHDHFQQESLYQFTYDGCLQGVLPFLGRGCHSFCPVYMGQRPPSSQCLPTLDSWKPGWHLYLRDGYGAIACVRVSID